MRGSFFYALISLILNNDTKKLLPVLLAGVSYVTLKWLINFSVVNI